MARHRLHFVDHNDTAAEGMKPANAAAAPGKQGVQQLDQRGNYDIAFPRCRQEFPAVQFFLCFRVIRRLLLHDVGVMLQDQAVIPDVLTDNLTALINNCKNRCDKQNPALSIPGRVSQRIAQGAEGLPCPGWHVQPVDAARLFGEGPAAVRDLTAGLLHLCSVGEFSQFSIYPIRQRFPEYTQLFRRPILRKAHALFKFRRIPAVAFDHGAEQEPRQHSQVEAGFFAGGLVLPQQRDELSVGLFDLCLRFCKEGIQLFLPGAVLQEAVHCFLIADVLLLQPMLKAGAVVAIHAVKKAVVSACNICQ